MKGELSFEDGFKLLPSAKQLRLTQRSERSALKACLVQQREREGASVLVQLRRQDEQMAIADEVSRERFENLTGRIDVIVDKLDGLANR